MKLLYHCVAQAIIAFFTLGSAAADDTEITNATASASAQPDPILAAQTAQNCADDASLPGNVLQFPVFYYVSISPEQNGWQPTADDWTWKSMMVGSTYHALLQFNVEDIPQDIDLRVVCASIDFEQTSSPTPLELHRITTPWTTKATWEYANDPTTPWNQAGGDYELNSLSSFEDGVHAPSTASLVTSVQTIVDGSGTEENHGFLVRARRTGDTAIELTNPHLYIRYVSSMWTAPSKIAYIPGTNTKPPDPVPWVQPVPKPSRAPIPRPNPSPVFFPTWDDDELILDSNQGRNTIAIALSVGFAVIGLIAIIVQLIVNRRYERNEVEENAAKVMSSEEEKVSEHKIDIGNDESFSDALSDKPVV